MSLDSRRSCHPCEWFDPAAIPTGRLAKQWQAAKPFPHVVLDDLLTSDGFHRLRAAVSQEPHYSNIGPLYEMMGSADQPEQPAIQEFNAFLSGPAVCEMIARITGESPSEAHVRSFVYLPGHYLLPHTDDDPVHRRCVAIIGYLSDEGACTGGELQLYECIFEEDQVEQTRAAVSVRPRPNRFVLMEVSKASLHRVMEIEQGARVSVAGWFYL